MNEREGRREPAPAATTSRQDKRQSIVPPAGETKPEPTDDFAEGFKFGWYGGYSAGVDDSDDRDAESWAKMANWLRRSANEPTFDELCRRRGETNPCPTRCRKCATCRRSLAYWASQADK